MKSKRVLVLLSLFVISFTSFARLGIATCPTVATLNKPGTVVQTAPLGRDRYKAVNIDEIGTMFVSLTDDTPVFNVNVWVATNIDHSNALTCNYGGSSLFGTPVPVTLRSESRGWRAENTNGAWPLMGPRCDKGIDLCKAQIGA